MILKVSIWSVLVIKQWEMGIFLEKNRRLNGQLTENWDIIIQKMLGLDSRISIHSQSKEVLNQKIDQSQRVSNLSTLRGSTNDGGQRPSTNSLKNAKAQKIRYLRSRLLEIENQQQSFSEKMKSCINVIENEVKKREEQNRELESEIRKLKGEIIEGTADLEVVSKFLNKKKTTNTVTMTRKYSPTSINNKNNKGENNNIPGKEIQIKEVNVAAQQSKRFSPKNRLYLKSNSPTAKDRGKYVYLRQKSPSSGQESPSPRNPRVLVPFK